MTRANGVRNERAKRVRNEATREHMRRALNIGRAVLRSQRRRQSRVREQGAVQ
jgi:hypothetical protein